MKALLRTACILMSVATACMASRACLGDGIEDALPGAVVVASVGEEERFGPTTRPDVPEATRPPLSTEKNVDTNKPIHAWQRGTDDWFGVRPKLDDRGITLQANAVLDSSWDLVGGLHRGDSAVRYLLNANITIDTERLAGWKGGSFFINFQNQAGGDGGEMVGDAQGVSNIDSRDLTQISELWYEQRFGDDLVRVKVGKVDANSEFARVENGGEFLNPSFGVSPTIVGMPRIRIRRPA
jgi:hypothetical protein